jgi:hypothetical protein
MPSFDGRAFLQATGRHRQEGGRGGAALRMRGGRLTGSSHKSRSEKEAAARHRMQRDREQREQRIGVEIQAYTKACEEADAVNAAAAAAAMEAGDAPPEPLPYPSLSPEAQDYHERRTLQPARIRAELQAYTEQCEEIDAANAAATVAAMEVGGAPPEPMPYPSLSPEAHKHRESQARAAAALAAAQQATEQARARQQAAERTAREVLSLRGLESEEQLPTRCVPPQFADLAQSTVRASKLAERRLYAEMDAAARARFEEGREEFHAQAAAMADHHDESSAGYGGSSSSESPQLILLYLRLCALVDAVDSSDAVAVRTPTALDAARISMTPMPTPTRPPPLSTLAREYVDEVREQYKQLRDNERKDISRYRRVMPIFILLSALAGGICCWGLVRFVMDIARHS